MGKSAFASAARTLAVSALALGSALALPAAGHAAINFADPSMVKLNGTATADATELTLNTDFDQAASAFLVTPINTAGGFTATFTLNLFLVGDDTEQADGVTFLVQNDPAGVSALGGGGGDIGAYGLTNNVGLAFRSFLYNSIGFFEDGDVYSTPENTFSLRDQNDNILVSVAYQSGLFTYSAHNTGTAEQVFNATYAFDLTTLGPTAYVGFTGGTGLLRSTQQVTDFYFTPTAAPTAAPEPAAWAMLIAGFGLSGAALRRRRAKTA